MVGFTYFQILALDTTQHISKIDEENISTDYCTISEKNKAYLDFSRCLQDFSIDFKFKIKPGIHKTKEKKNLL